MTKAVVIYTDGACSGNPGPGGWACVIATPEGRVVERAGREEPTTNNRMEMGAVIAGLRAAFPDLPDTPDARTVFLKLRELRNSW
mgnify:CR=1 FL=1